MKARWLGVLLGLFCTCACAEPAGLRMLAIGNHRLRVEVADTDRLRETGLMFRRSLPESAGMLFVFDAPGRYCFWMKNTLIPLSVAFLDGEGRIIDLADMEPQTENVHCPERPARYALEMNKGWFQKRGIGSGAVVSGFASRY